eukprot:TRINITY_DN27455_c0_g3_i1.p1 TRINITY_DN27455_c0_g3~~TRINITY_DN27455_c0_g3_i1.p1  ORF type:complete len:313 (-),score=78.93 TRINITY_DN27455_c0_g3_i1:47-985(-)
MWSGAEVDGVSWTQTQDEVEVRVPAPAGTRGRDVRVDFRPKNVSVSIGGNLVEALKGELNAPVHPDECVWDMESGDVVVTLLKAAEDIWSRLLTHHDLKKMRRIDGGDDEDPRADKERVMGNARKVVQDLFVQAQAGDLTKFEEAMIENRDDSTPDDDEADRNLLANVKDGNSRTALHFAAHGAQPGIVEFILNRNPDMVDALDNEQNTPLHLALLKGCSETSRLLMDRGANVTLAKQDGTTALHHAAASGDEALVRSIVEAKADLEATSPSGTPIHWAAGEGAMCTLKALLDLKADPNTCLLYTSPSPRDS